MEFVKKNSFVVGVAVGGLVGGAAAYALLGSSRKKKPAAPAYPATAWPKGKPLYGPVGGEYPAYDCTSKKTEKASFMAVPQGSAML